MKKKNIVTVDVKFGQPSKDCLNFGICKMDFYRKGTPYRPTKDAIAKLTNIDNEFSLVFIKETMSSNIKIKHFNNLKFIVLEQFTLPRAICNALGLHTLTIAKGTYTVYESELGFQVPIRKEMGMSI